MTVVPQDLELMIRKIEGRALSEYYYFPYRQPLEGAIARSLLGGLVQQRAISSADLAWIAFVPGAPVDAAEWYVTRETGPTAGNSWSPEREGAPIGLYQFLYATWQQPRIALQHTAVEKLPDDVRSSGQMQTVAVLHHYRCVDPVVPAVERLLGGWIVLAQKKAAGREFFPLTTAVETEFRRMRDQLRLTFSVEPFTLRMVSSLERRYQRGVIRALEAPGFDTWLEGRESGETVALLSQPAGSDADSAANSEIMRPVPGPIVGVDRTTSSGVPQADSRGQPSPSTEQQPAVDGSAMRVSPDALRTRQWLIDQFSARREELKREFQKTVEEYSGAEARVQLTSSLDKRLNHDQGDFHGFSPMSRGLAILEFVATERDVQHCLANLYARGAPKRDILIVFAGSRAIIDVLRRDVMPEWKNKIEIRDLELV